MGFERWTEEDRAGFAGSAVAHGDNDVGRRTLEGIRGQSLSGGVTTVGMLVGVLMVLLSFALTGIYVHRANNVLDPLNDKVKQECAQ